MKKYLIVIILLLTSCSPWYAKYDISKNDLASPTSVPGLIKALNDKSSRVRLKAVKRLGNIGPDARMAAGPLVKTLNDTNASVRIDSVISLGKIKANNPSVVNGLMKSLNNHDSLTRLEAIRSLYSIGYRGDDFIEQLKIIAVTGRHRTVRNIAMNILQTL